MLASEQRRCYRFPIAADEGETLIELDGCQHTAQLLDRSSEGFCVEASAELDLSEGQTIRVLSPAGWHEARIMRCQRLDNRLRLGLFRTGDVIETSKGRRIAGRPRGWKEESRSWFSSTTAIALGFLVIVVAAPFILAHSDWSGLFSYFVREQSESREAGSDSTAKILNELTSNGR